MVNKCGEFGVAVNFKYSLKSNNIKYKYHICKAFQNTSKYAFNGEKWTHT